MPDTTPNAKQSTVSNDPKLIWAKETLARLRNFRRPYDQRRSYFYRQYVGQRDRRLYPDNMTPRSNTFFPYAQSNVDAVVSRTRDAFFSIDPPIEARCKGGTDYAAMQMQNVELTCLKRANWITKLEELLSNICIYGHGAVKVDWDWDYETAIGPEPTYMMIPEIDPNTGQPIIDYNTGQPVMLPFTGPDGQPIQTGVQMVTQRVPRNCPKIYPIDIYDFMVDPDEDIISILTEKSYGSLMREYEANPKLYRPEAVTEIMKRINAYKEEDRDGILIRIAEIWDKTKQDVTIITSPDDWDALSWKDRRYQYRNASYSAYKRRLYTGPSVILYTGPNPHAHKRIPILHMPYTKVPGDTYGYGLIERISDLNEGLNVFVNMITDNWNMGINRRYAYDTQADIDHEQLDQGNTPGGKVGVTGDPNKVIAPLPFFTPNQGDYDIIPMYQGMIEMSSGISDFYSKGIGSPTGNRTSSGISQVINESGYTFKRFIGNFEIEVLQPLCEMVAAMIQQYGSDEMEYDITAQQPGIPKYGRVKLASLIGNYSFDFVGANYATGKVVKQRNLMAFYQIAMQSPYANQGEFLREIARAMEIPLANRLLKPDAQVQQEQAQSRQMQYQEDFVRELLKVEQRALPAALSQAGKEGPGNQIASDARKVQAVVEDYLNDTAEMLFPPHPPETGRRVGRPSTSQHEGQIPGGRGGTEMSSFAQAMSANALGTAGNQ
jgi:hypothetical protein